MDINQILKEMSLDEKVGQLNQKLYGWQVWEKKDNDLCLTDSFKKHVADFGGVGAIYGILRADPWSEIDFNSGLDKKESREVIRLVSDYVMNNSRHKIRPLIVEETPHGHQGLNSELYPVNLSLACSFNPKLIGNITKNITKEMSSLNVNVGLFSGLDILRDHRWGRCEETFGEDPILAAKYTKEIVSNTDKNNFIACLKHFAAQGAPYQGHNSGSVQIGIRELHEIHLAASKAAVKAGLKMCMAAYNEIDGVPCHANKYLLRDVLRSKYGFEGVVMADGCALDRLISKNVSISKAGLSALKAGVGLSLWDDCYLNLGAAVKDGVVDISYIDEAVLNILKIKKRCGLIDCRLEDFDEKIDRKLSYESACESVVLLKNEKNYLPFTLENSVLIIGDADDLYLQLGDYTPPIDLKKYQTIYEQLQLEFKQVEICSYLEVKNIDIERYDKVIMIIGGSSKRDFGGEFESNGALKKVNTTTDCGENVDISNLSYPKIQLETSSYLSKKNCNFLAIGIQGRGYGFENINSDSSAILLAFYPGPYGANALVDIILGKVNPSGKLATSLATNNGYSNHYYNKKQDFSRTDYIDDASLITYGFGYGLSFSDFEYKNMSVQKKIRNIEITVDVKNTSQFDGQEVIQLYVAKNNSFITKRERELVDFKKQNIGGGETKKINFEISFAQLEILDMEMNDFFESGYYNFIIGTGNQTFLEKEIHLG